MNKISEEIFYNYQQRKGGYAKNIFARVLEKGLSEKGIELNEERSGDRYDSNNLVIGDIESAKVIFTAHYDTKTAGLFPNFATPKNRILWFLYIVLMMVVVVAFGASASLFIWGEVSIPISLGCIALLAAMMLFGKPSETTANDNTSGVITLIETAIGMTPKQRESVAFIFFDNNNRGKQGSKFFAQKYKGKLDDKLIVNFDSISEGFNMMFIEGAGISKNQKKLLAESFLQRGKMTPIFASSKEAFFNSDHLNFDNAVGVVALRKNKILGLFVDKIGTTRDTVFQKVNIEYLKEGCIDLVDKMQ